MAVTTTGLLIAGLATSVVGTGVAAYSAYQQGKAQQGLANYNAAVNEQAALDTQRDGRIAAQQTRAQNRKQLARTRALYAKAGVVVGTGTPLLVQVEQAGELEMRALEVQQQSNAQAAQLRQQAAFDRVGGSVAKRAGTLNTAATILQGASSAAAAGTNYRLYKGI